MTDQRNTERQHMEITIRPLTSIRPYDGNPRVIPEAAVRKVAASLREFGWRQPLVVDTAGVLIVGHTRYLAAHLLGWEDAPVHIADGLSPEQVAAYRIADNRTGEETRWDDGALRVEITRLSENARAAAGFDQDEIDLLVAKARASVADLLREDEEAPVAPGCTITRPGDVWQLGRHRLGCYDCTDRAAVSAMLAGQAIDCLLTDPPYCSGGFQESGRSAGSIGTKRKDAKGKEYAPRIANDQLSTRGYQCLIKSTLEAWPAAFAYVFTDWRMWNALYDSLEASGLGLRNMIVWDKGTPGMGRGWRTQHELVAFAARGAPNFDNHKAQGNVIASKRTGNKHHPTEKPIELLASILGVTDFCNTIADPFAGSGTTILAAELCDRTCYASELDPTFVDTAVRRWQQQTGDQATRIADGRAFDDLAAEAATDG